MIFVAAAVILASAVQRFIHPVALERLGAGLAISTVATAVNGAVGLALIRAGRTHRSATLAADGKHLMTDVWTSVGVLVGVLLVALTGWERLDPVVAAIVGLNILVTGYRLVVGSAGALLDAALTPRKPPRSPPSSTGSAPPKSTSTACRPASQVGTGSSMCMCSSPERGPCSAAMTCSNRSSRPSRRRCRTPPCKPIWNPARTPAPTPTSPTTAIPPPSRPDNRHTDRTDGGRRSTAVIDVHRGLRRWRGVGVLQDCRHPVVVAPGRP